MRPREIQTVRAHTGAFTGTYAVTPECEVSAGITVTSGPNQGLHLDEAGSVTGEGESKEIHDIFTTARLGLHGHA